MDRLQQLLDRADALGVDMTEHTTRIRQVSCCSSQCFVNYVCPPEAASCVRGGNGSVRVFVVSSWICWLAASEAVLRVSPPLVCYDGNLHRLQAAGEHDA